MASATEGEEEEDEELIEVSEIDHFPRIPISTLR